MLHNEDTLAESLSSRAYLVSLPFERQTFHISIKSHEARSQREAIHVALIRSGAVVGSSDTLDFGRLIGKPTSVEDTDENRYKAGIRDHGYPPSYVEHADEWYNDPGVHSTQIAA